MNSFILFISIPTKIPKYLIPSYQRENVRGRHLICVTYGGPTTFANGIIFVNRKNSKFRDSSTELFINIYVIKQILEMLLDKINRNALWPNWVPRVRTTGRFPTSFLANYNVTRTIKFLWQHVEKLKSLNCSLVRD